MGYSYTINRKINIEDKDIQKQLNITDICDYNYHYSDLGIILKSFYMNNIKYYEYIDKITSSNGNFSMYSISIIENNNIIPNTLQENIDQGYECPYCHEYHNMYTINNEELLDIKCIRCGNNFSLCKECDSVEVKNKGDICNTCKSYK